MEEDTVYINGATWVRYEAFSNFATQISHCTRFKDVGTAVVTHAKYVFDAFAIRLSFRAKQGSLIFEVSENKHQYTFDREDALSVFEDESFKNNIPLKLDRAQIQSHPILKQSLFAHASVCCLFVLPMASVKGQSVVVTVAGRHPFSELDYRFIKLCSEVLMTKFSQLFLIEALDEHNLALKNANEELTLLNREFCMLNNSLEKLVAHRTHKLSEAQKELSTLFYRTSHDFRRPLASILGLANLMEMAKDQEEVNFLLSYLRSSVNDISTMLDKFQLLSLAELEDNRMEEIYFAEILENLEQKYALACEQHAIRFTYTVHTTKDFYSYRLIIRAILDNLLDNAIKYCNKQNAYVHTDIQEQDDMLVMTVSDNGEGIPKKLQQRIFDMYFRASDRSQGHGLGLYVMKKLLDGLNGVVTFESEPYHQTTFRIFVPNLRQKIQKQVPSYQAQTPSWLKA